MSPNAQFLQRFATGSLAVITSGVEDADTAFDCVLFDWREAGLRSPSAMRSYLFAVEQSEVAKIGHLSDAD